MNQAQYTVYIRIYKKYIHDLVVSRNPYLLRLRRSEHSHQVSGIYCFVLNSLHFYDANKVLHYIVNIFVYIRNFTRMLLSLN